MFRGVAKARTALARSLAALAFGAASFASVVCAAPTAAAQTPPPPTKDLAQLRQVFSDGRQLEDKGQWADALEKFREVAAAKMTPQVRFHIALCEENLGKLVAAKHDFELAAAEGTAAGTAAAEVPPAAKEHVDALIPRIARIQIEAKGKLSTSKILLDNAAIGERDLGVEIEVDPGTHVVEVRDASGKSTFRKEVATTAKATEKVSIVVTDTDEPPPPPPSDSSRVPAYVTGAVGVAALIGSGVFFGLRASNISSIKATCTNMVALTGCSPGDQSMATTGKVYTGLADALLVLGVAGVGTGVALFFVLGPKKQSPPTGTQPKSATSLWLAPSGPGLALGGTF
jgi:hypothetical protein